MARTYFSKVVKIRTFVLAFFGLCPVLSATPLQLDLSTVTEYWFVTGAGALDQPALHMQNAAGVISFNSWVGQVKTDGTPSGVYVNGGSAAAFNGIWYAEARFFLPATTMNVSLNLTGLVSDDRAQVFLNDDPLTNPGATPLWSKYAQAALDSPPATASYQPIFGYDTVTRTCYDANTLQYNNGVAGVAGSCYNDQPTTYNGAATSVSTTSGLNYGGLNILRIYVNNVGVCSGNAIDCMAAGTTSVIHNASDGTWVTLNAALSYEGDSPIVILATPEPATYLGFASGLLALIGVRRFRRSC